MKQFVWVVMTLLLGSYNVSAQKADPFKYVSGAELSITGRSTLADSQSYHRISPPYSDNLPERVQELAKNSAGISLTFQTNSTDIRVKWRLGEYITLWNMTPLAVNGLDLYGWNGKEWQYISSAAPSGIKNSAMFVENLDGRLRHYKVNLPLYTELSEIEIGVNKLSVIKPADIDYLPSRKIVIYGSSITQGASASRPGMAWPSIVSRVLNAEIFNLGFSGSGKMEIEIANVIGQIPADLIVLDCVPNPSPEQIKDRAVPFIKRLRELEPETPILMVESIFRERVLKQKKAFKQAHQQLLKEGFNQIYYIPSEELTGGDHELTVDGTHLSDMGQAKIANRISQSIIRILQLK